LVEYRCNGVFIKVSGVLVEVLTRFLKCSALHQIELLILQNRRLYVWLSEDIDQLLPLLL
jgi:hypothetical protein